MQLRRIGELESWTLSVSRASVLSDRDSIDPIQNAIGNTASTKPIAAMNNDRLSFSIWA